jgi:DNA polymerase I-like protein with 3'-5' exonuclease and polymerase domains
MEGRKNREPTPIEIAACRPLLETQLNAVRPKRILALGNTPFKALTGHSGIGKYRGKEFPLKGFDFDASVTVTYHPAYIMRNPKAYPLILLDFKRFFTQGGESLPVDYATIETLPEWNDLLRRLLKSPEIAYDIETVGLDSWRHKDLLCISLSDREGWSRVVPLEGKFSPWSKEQLKAIYRGLSVLLSRKDKQLIAHHSKFDIQWLWTRGIKATCSFDTMISATLLEENLPHTLETSIQLYVDPYFTKPDPSNIEEWKWEDAWVYSAGDADWTLRLYHAILPHHEREIHPPVFNELMMPVQTVILPQLELDGIYVVPENIEPAIQECEEKLTLYHQQIMEHVPADFVPKVKNKKAREAGFNPGSDKQLGDLLFNYLHLPVLKLTKGKQPSVSEEVLKELEESHPIISPLMEWKKWGKLLNTFLIRWRDEDRDEFGKIHPHYNTKPVTGRLSCVPLDTQALTKQGWRKWDELTIGEPLLGYDIVHDCYKWTPLKNIHRGKGQLGGVKVGRRRREEELIRCTPNHKWVVAQKRDQKCRPDFRGILPAEDIALGRNLSLVTQLTTPAPEGEDTTTPTEAALIGWAITDGHLRKTGEGRYSLSIRVTKPSSIQALEMLLTGVPHTRHAYKGAEDFSLGVETFMPLWSRFSGREEEYILGLSSPARNSMFDAMMEADGNVTTGHNRFSKGRGSLGELAMELLALLLGKPYTSRYHNTNKSYPMREFTFLGERRFNLNTSYKGSSTGEMEEVWCPETELGTWVMRQGRHVAITGNSSDPNLQQVPKDSKIRKCLGAPPGYKMVKSDYSQIELRLAAHYAKDKTMLAAYNEGQDLHSLTAASILGISYKVFKELLESGDIATKKARSDAKPCNFGFLYGMFPQKFVDYAKNEYGVIFTLAEATRFRDLFFSTYSNLLPWHEEQKRMAAEYLSVTSMIGRVRHLPNMMSSDWKERSEAERQSINSPVQSLASDFVLMSATILHRLLPRDWGWLAGLIHDEVLYCIKEEHAEEWAKTVREVMCNPPLGLYTTEKLLVPLDVEVKIMDTWGG